MFHHYDVNMKLHIYSNSKVAANRDDGFLLNTLRALFRLSSAEYF